MCSNSYLIICFMKVKGEMFGGINSRISVISSSEYTGQGIKGMICPVSVTVGSSMK